MASYGDRIWAASGLLFVLLFGAGLFAADLVTTPYPGFLHPIERLEAYFTQSQRAVQALSLFHSLAAFALLLFAGYLATILGRDKQPGVNGAALVTLGCGSVAAGFLLLSALLFWVLAIPSITEDPALLRALHTLAYLAGGVALALPLAAFIGAPAIVALRGGPLPRWLGWTGLISAGFCLLYPVTLLRHGGQWGPGGIIATTTAIVAVLWILALSLVLLRRSFGNRNKGSI